ncbi:uncharacterized protein LOC135317960 [Phalacrocorax carbo]|uniref:uncharacterized protein LOC135317960 n=1 Tax=Phalacrocorax carbo TaxID=9209 RepID=UPI0031193DC7
MSPWLVPTAPAALLRLHQPQPVVAVEVGGTVEIRCEASEAMKSKAKVWWYHRGGRAGPSLVLDCQSGTKGRFSCEYGGYSVTLRITGARPQDTGLYLCVYGHSWLPDFGNGTALLVGALRIALHPSHGFQPSSLPPSADSWSKGSWVRVLALRGAPPGPPSLVCAVGASTGPVLVSWRGAAWGMLGLGGGEGPLLSPMGTAGGAGGLCEVRFNASGRPVRRSVELHEATGCSFLSPSAWGPAGVGALLLLSLGLSTCCLRRPTRTAQQPGAPMPPASREDEGELNCAQLNFAARAGPRP